MHWLKEFFKTTSSERNGAIVLLGIIVCLCLYYIVMYNRQPQLLIIENNVSDYISPVDSIKEKKDQLKYFKFNPNKIDVNGWLELGFSVKQANSIIKYRFSIGGFRNPEDLLSCYVIDSLKYYELFPYIDIQLIAEHEVENKTKNIEQLNSFSVCIVSSDNPIYDGFDKFEKLYYYRDEKGYQYFSSISEDSISLIMPLQSAIDNGFKSAAIKKINSKQLINISPKNIILDINSVDSIQLRTLKGIGPVLSKRIIEYRVKLGGFIQIEQINEVYGVREETYDMIVSKIQILDTSVFKININECSVDQLRAHPYFNWNIANSIVNFRLQHGSYKALEKIKSIHLVNDEIYRKIAPYLRIE